jgi:hypothetical protein
MKDFGLFYGDAAATLGGGESIGQSLPHFVRKMGGRKVRAP